MRLACHCQPSSSCHSSRFRFVIASPNLSGRGNLLLPARLRSLFHSVSEESGSSQRQKEKSYESCEPVCFITTAAYGTPTPEQIDVLREFRDIVLLESTAGFQFVALYYQLSPPVADFITGNELLRTLVRELLVDPIVWVVEATGDIWRN